MSNALAVVGNVSRDTVNYGGASRGPFWGGAGLYISVSAASSGTRSRLISVVGEDALYLLSQIEDLVDISLVQVLEGETCRFDIQYSADGTLLNINCDFGVAGSLNSYFQEIDLPPAHYHVSCRQPVNPKQILHRILEKGFPFSLDFILSSAWQKMAEAAIWIQRAKYVFVNSQELEILQSLQSISGIQALIVTSGGQPVRVFKFGREVLRKGYSTKESYDVTGAGDILIGAFLASQLEGDELYKSLEKAVLLAQKSIDSVGALHFFYRNVAAQHALAPDAASATLRRRR